MGACLNLAAIGQLEADLSATGTSSSRSPAGNVPKPRVSAPTPTSPGPRVSTPVPPPRVSPSQAVTGRYTWKRNIPTTIFWIGEKPTPRNPTPNHASSWDVNWKVNYGGLDSPDPNHRTAGFRPRGFIPRQNPFYVALPYNDVAKFGKTKEEAPRVIPWFHKRFTKPGTTVLKGQWLVIRHGNRLCYAQWEDCGPFTTDDWPYVFGNARPKNRENGGAGLDVSPAVRDFLGLKSGGQCDWKFVSVSEVPAGPWRAYGDNNHFVQARGGHADPSGDGSDKPTLDELRAQRQRWLEQNMRSAVRGS